MVIARKLKKVSQALDSIATRENLAQFLNGTENGWKVNDLVEDIHDALIIYQVCTPKLLAVIASNSASAQTSLQQEIYNEDCQMIVSLAPLLHNHIC